MVYLPDEAVDQVYAHVATGFSDTSAFLRELTLKSMLVLAPKVYAFSIIAPVLSIISNWWQLFNFWDKFYRWFVIKCFYMQVTNGYLN